MYTIKVEALFDGLVDNCYCIKTLYWHIFFKSGENRFYI